MSCAANAEVKRCGALLLLEVEVLEVPPPWAVDGTVNVGMKEMGGVVVARCGDGTAAWADVWDADMGRECPWDVAWVAWNEGVAAAAVAAGVEGVAGVSCS